MTTIPLNSILQHIQLEIIKKLDIYHQARLARTCHSMLKLIDSSTSTPFMDVFVTFMAYSLPNGDEVFKGLIITGRRIYSIEETKGLLDRNLRFVVRKLLLHLRPRCGIRAIYLFQEGRVLTENELDDREFNYEQQNKVNLNGRFVPRDMIIDTAFFCAEDLPILERLNETAKVSGLRVSELFYPFQQSPVFCSMTTLYLYTRVNINDILLFSAENMFFRFITWEKNVCCAGINQFLKQWNSGSRKCTSIRLLINLSTSNHPKIFQDLPYSTLWTESLHKESPISKQNYPNRRISCEINRNLSSPPWERKALRKVND